MAELDAPAVSEILTTVKARLIRTDDRLDGYLTGRISSVVQELAGAGIIYDGSARDCMLVVDMVCWQYSNRDKNEAVPEWLRLARRERWLQQHRETSDDT